MNDETRSRLEDVNQSIANATERLEQKAGSTMARVKTWVVALLMHSTFYSLTLAGPWEMVPWGWAQNLATFLFVVALLGYAWTVFVMHLFYVLANEENRHRLALALKAHHSKLREVGGYLAHAGLVVMLAAAGSLVLAFAYAALVLASVLSGIYWERAAENPPVKYVLECPDCHAQVKTKRDAMSVKRCPACLGLLPAGMLLVEEEPVTHGT